MSQELRSLAAELTEAIKPRMIQVAEAYWRLATTGNEAEARRAAELETELRLFFADKETYVRLKAAAAAPTGDAMLDRQVLDLYHGYLENQLDKDEIEAMVTAANELEQIFATFRGTVDGKPLSDNEIRELLVASTDNEERRKAWRASKQIGEQVSAKLVALVKLRNAAARRLGFANFYEMQLELSEIKRTDLFALFAELKRLTDEPFARMKAQLDGEQAKRFGITPQGMQPWHYADPFFQEVPASESVDIDPYFAGQSIEELSTRFYDSVGLDVRDIIARSDLYERPGKNQHAFCTDIDREGDVRVLCNLKPNGYWMATMLHELGHGVYDKYVDPDLPWLLRRYAHINSTEAIAMYFGRLTRDPGWLHEIAGVDATEAERLGAALHEEQSRSMLIFVRWVLVMVGFESRLYENPDQDLNQLWWELVRDIQLVTPPEELNGHEWSTKVHIATVPVYYHNYLIGEVTASHLKHHIAQFSGTPRIAGNMRVGTWLQNQFFKPGALYTWNDLVEHATGEALNPRYFVEDFVR
jgi:peptidyl-dipeptidase A